MALSRRLLKRRNVKYLNRFLNMRYTWKLLHLIKPNNFYSLIEKEMTKPRMSKKFKTFEDVVNPEPFLSRWCFKIYRTNPVQRSRVKMFCSGSRLIRKDQMQGTHAEYMAYYILRGTDD
jgi:hypothetical protein